MRAILALAVLAAACSEVGPFYCDDSIQCVVEDDAGMVYQGVCVAAYAVCAFADPTCPAPDMLRYDESAGELAGVCVGDE